MRRIAAVALALATATGSRATGIGTGIPPAQVRTAQCTLPGAGTSGQIIPARDIADSGKRPAPKHSNSLFKRSNAVPLAEEVEVSRLFATPGKVFDAASGCILVAVPERAQVIAMDAASGTVTRSYALAGGDRPATMLLDAVDRLLFIGDEGNAMLDVVSLKSMEVMDAVSIPAPASALAFDAGWHRLYVVAADGRVSGFDIRRSRLMPAGASDQLSATGVAVDSGTHAVYLTQIGTDEHPVLRLLRAAPPPAPRCVFHHSTPGSRCLAKYAVTR